MCDSSLLVVESDVFLSKAFFFAMGLLFFWFSMLTYRALLLGFLLELKLSLLILAPIAFVNIFISQRTQERFPFFGIKFYL